MLRSTQAPSSSTYLWKERRGTMSPRQIETAAPESASFARTLTPFCGNHVTAWRANLDLWLLACRPCLPNVSSI